MTTMICKMKQHAEERNQLCICLARIAKERDIKNKEKWELGEKPQVKLDIFTMPNHIKIMFGEFLKTPKYTELATLRGHTEWVNCLTLHENKLYSSSEDNTIRIWDTDTREEIASLKGHTNSVTCLTIHENKLYSGSWDKTIRIWNIETYELVATLIGHTGNVVCLTIHENKLYSESDDNTIRLWKV